MNPSIVAVYDMPTELETAKLEIPWGKFTTKVVSAGVFCELLLAMVRVSVTAWPIEMPAHVVVLVPVMESKGGAVVGPGVTAPGAVGGLGVAVLCHRGLWF